MMNPMPDLATLLGKAKLAGIFGTKMRSVIKQANPAGIEAIAATLGEERDTLEDVVEPYLLQIGFVRRTKRGREVTPQARAHVGLA